MLQTSFCDFCTKKEFRFAYYAWTSAVTVYGIDSVMIKGDLGPKSMLNTHK